MMHYSVKGVGKGDVTLPQKNVEKQERKKQLSGCKHAVLHTKIEAQKCQIYEFCCHYVQQTHWLHCT